MITTVIFDFGGVVLNWDVRHLFRSVFDTEPEMETFLSSVLTPSENLRLDLGMPLDDLCWELATHHPQYQTAIEAWRTRWVETVPSEIDGTAELIATLKAAGYRVTGLSNFSRETFELCRKRFPVLAMFEDIVLSGDHGIAKPDHNIYELAMARIGIDSHEAVFFDDSAVNVNGAIQVGMSAFLFVDAATARQQLHKLGVDV